MRGFGWCGVVLAVVLATGCAAGVAGFGAPPLSALQAQCGGLQADYGADAPAVYSALLDAYVGYRHRRVTQADFCAFQNSIAERHAALVAGGSDARPAWAEFFNEARVKAINWRAAVDPSLRGG
ncbi:hypothetical protein [Trinickia sp. EG282A]|uniref:hypothetical protein n=1 Tax=Trinickia sp. EG282A TaxID=3237013 RepID=UPI0034D1C279